MTENIRVSSAEETERVGFELAKLLDEKGVKRAFIAMFGEMGVGKTAFSRGFASYFGIRSVKSPTYTVLNEYKGKAKIHHFDFYRITDGDDLYSIGYDDVIEDEGFSLSEWTEHILDFIPEDSVRVTISRVTNEEGDGECLRDIKIDYNGFKD